MIIVGILAMEKEIGVSPGIIELESQVLAIPTSSISRAEPLSLVGIPLGDLMMRVKGRCPLKLKILGELKVRPLEEDLEREWIGGRETNAFYHTRRIDHTVERIA